MNPLISIPQKLEADVDIILYKAFKIDRERLEN